MKALYEDFLVKQAQFLSEDDSNNELASNLVKLKHSMTQRVNGTGSRGPS
jgi:hypothetical protein